MVGLSAGSKGNRGEWTAAAAHFAFVVVLSAGVVCISQGVAAQGDGSFEACAVDMEKSPGDAYDSCGKFVERSPTGDSENVRKAKKWLQVNAPNEQYVRFLKSLVSEEKAGFVVYQPDMTIELPPVDRHDELGSVKVARRFGNPNEEGLLRKAEAVYPGPAEMVRRFFLFGAGRLNGPNEPMEPFWGIAERTPNPDLSIVTARSVRYYYDLREDYKKKPKLGPLLAVTSVTMDYEGAIRHQDRYAHGDTSFDDVYVADLTLMVDLHCGGLCGGGFKRNKVVVIDRHGDVTALFLDAPMNFETTFY